MNKLFFIFTIIFLLLVSCQEESTTEEKEVQLETNQRGQFSHIQLNEVEFVILLKYMYDNYQEDSLKDLTLIEQEATMRIYNTFLAHSGRCTDKHWFYDSKATENYWKCSFNSNFMDQVEELHPLDSNQYPISRYYINDMNIALYGPCADNFMKHCPLIIPEESNGFIELRSNP